MKERDYSAATEVFEATEAMLYAWGRERAQLRRSMRRSLTLPTRSSITGMIESQRVFETRRASRCGVKRKPDPIVEQEDASESPVKFRLCGKGHIYRGNSCPKCVDAKREAIELGNAQPELTARGTATRSSAPPRCPMNSISSRALTVDEVLQRLPGWMRYLVDLKYADDQPDRICAKQMKIEREEFSRMRRAAVAHIAEMLANRKKSQVRSARPVE
jgi:hypothetical protein